jgi:hypothetical protein
MALTRYLALGLIVSCQLGNVLIYTTILLHNACMLARDDATS